MTDRIRVLVVDDHPVVRAGLAALLGLQPELTVVAEVADGATAIARARELRPDVVLCDLRLGDGPDGVAVCRELADDIPVLILTTYDHDVDLVRAVEAGAVGYLLKDAEPATITRALVAAAAGQDVWDPDLERRVVATMRTRTADLSARELDVLRLVDRGLSNRQIARELFVSEATVKTHLNHAFGKLRVDSRTAAVAAARNAGLI